eukprot:TRINITY_DN10375_c0_g1_i2.p1 TRINITY_DN10375_c0_g1~~TRINITY_DN10375_c0_g1_i2.p1  ORF type:complete len:251 (-),score=-21.54 TRINITY_DN10375_c0_g1_i2:45-797(-)
MKNSIIRNSIYFAAVIKGFFAKQFIKQFDQVIFYLKQIVLIISGNNFLFCNFSVKNLRFVRCIEFLGFNFFGVVCYIGVYEAETIFYGSLRSNQIGVCCLFMQQKTVYFYTLYFVEINQSRQALNEYILLWYLIYLVNIQIFNSVFTLKILVMRELSVHVKNWYIMKLRVCILGGSQNSMLGAFLWFNMHLFLFYVFAGNINLIKLIQFITLYVCMHYQLYVTNQCYVGYNEVDYMRKILWFSGSHAQSC